MDEKTIAERVQAEMSQARFQHTQGVVEAAEVLAGRFGVDVEAARTAAWIHDVAREWPTEKLLQYAERVEIPSGFAVIPNLLHGPIGAAIAHEWFDVGNLDIANAIRYHTTGRVGMSQLEMILCLADGIEAGRNYPGIDDIRHWAELDLTYALAQSFDCTLTYLIKRNEPIFPLTVMARNDLWERVKPIEQAYDTLGRKLNERHNE